ncbi:hypothetical protein IMY05_C4347000700 [Salix suchowensis]|nr:hypothetical protein IMY05_C4347000700 [Salix suchowensis]
MSLRDEEEVARLREEDLGDFDDDDDDDGEYQYLLEEEGVDAEELERRHKMIELQRLVICSPWSFNAHIGYSNISALPNTIINILEQVREQTSFMGVCAFFGSEPKASRNITAYTSSVGETAAGTTIEEYIEGFKMDFEDQLVDFGCEGKKNYGPGKRPDSRVGSNGPSTKKRGWRSNLRKIATLKAAASCISSVSSRQTERRKRNRDSDSEDNNLPVNTAFDDDDDSTHGEDTADKEKEKLAGAKKKTLKTTGKRLRCVSHCLTSLPDGRGDA